MKEEDSKYLTIEYKGHNIILYQNNNDWFSYSSLPSNVQHHLFSFRWYKAFDILLIIDIIDDFINFFNNKINGDYRALFYLGKIADHTASTRLNIFKNIKDQALNLGFVRKAEKILSECNKTFDSINSEETYCFFTNHALMADIALLTYIDSSNKGKDDIERVFERILINLEAIFDFETGACKEHSISYQEYNLNILYTIKEKINKYIKLYPTLNSVNSSINDLYNKVSNFSRFLLYSAFITNRGYIPLGDSFEECKPQVLRRAFNVETPSKLLDDKYRNMILFSESFGSYIYKSEKITLSLHNSLHSATHKQNDDLSITLAVLGIPIIIDGGHHDIHTKPLALKSERSHSLPLLAEKKLLPPNKVEKNSRLILEENGYSVVGTHHRYLSATMERKVKIGTHEIRIVDSCNDKSSKVISQYIISPDVEVLHVRKNKILLQVGDILLELTCLKSISFEDIKVIYGGEVRDTTKIVLTNEESLGNNQITTTISLPNASFRNDSTDFNLVTDNSISKEDTIDKAIVEKEPINCYVPNIANIKLTDIGLDDFSYMTYKEIGNISYKAIANICRGLFTNNELYQSLDRDFYHCRPVFSYYKNSNNYIFFNGDLSFWLVQRINTAFVVMFPYQKLVVHRGSNNEKISTVIDDISFLMNEKLKFISEPKFCLINGYPRPYHYFYETLQAFKNFDLSLFSEVVDVEESAFLPSTLFVSKDNNKVVSQGMLNNYLSENNYIGLAATAMNSVNQIDFLEKFSDEISTVICDNTQLSIIDYANKPIVWIGICQSSRIWIEQEEALIKSINKIKNSYPNAFFIFDGLTCPHYLNSEKFVIEKCSGETNLLSSIIAKTKVIENQYLSVIGAHATKKISLSQKIDFFISDALTDSTWPAAFGKKPGIAYAIQRARIVHSHPKTIFIPKDKVEEVGDGTGNWARVSFSIDPDFFSEFVLEHLNQTIQF